MSERSILRTMRSRRQAKSSQRSAAKCARAVLESLEERRLLANAAIVVNATNDEAVDSDGKISLREAILAAEAQAGDDTITFDSTVFASGSLHTISLGAEPLDITGANGKLTITGPGADTLEIDASNSGRSFDVDNGATATISGMAMRSGTAQGGGVQNKGDLTLTSVNIHNNGITASPGPANPSGDGFKGNDALGAGVYNTGTLAINASTIAFNGATAGKGGSGIGNGGAGGDAAGAGVYSLGNVTLSACTFTGNIAHGGDGGQGFGGGGEGGGAAGAALYVTGGTLGIAGGDFEDNSAQGGTGMGGGLGDGGAGGAVFGGAVYCDNALAMNGVAFNLNGAEAGQGGNAGTGGNPGDGGGAQGGGVYAGGAVSGSSNTFAENAAIGGFSGAQTNTTDNTAHGGSGFGGGLALGTGASGSLDETTFASNEADGGLGGSSDSAHQGAAGGQALGGGLYSTSNDFTFHNVSFTNNQAVGASGGAGGSSGLGGGALGGGVYYGGAHTLNLLGGEFHQNVAAGADDTGPIGSSAGTGNGGGIGADGKVLADQVTFDLNSAKGGLGDAQDQSAGGSAGGGAIWTSNDLTITRSTIFSNAVTAGNSHHAAPGNAFGGGIEAIGGNLSIETTTVSANTATGGKNVAAIGTFVGGAANGGGIFAGGAQSNITTSLIDNNTAQAGAGATVSAGNAGDGGIATAGGVYMAGTPKLTDSTITANRAIGGNGGSDSSAGAGGNAGAAIGGGVYAVVPAILINDTIYQNGAQSGSAGASSGGGANGTATDSTGGGIVGAALTTLTNTIVSNNDATDDPDIHADINASHDLIGDVSVGTIFNSDTSNLKNVDPQLAALADNGGFTKTLKPLDVSPVFDKGDNAAALAEFGADGTDQRGVGFPRFLGTVDIGAVESGLPIISVSGNGQTIANNDTTPAPTDFTDLGMTNRIAAQTLERGFVISNTGQLPLQINSINVPGGYVVADPGSPTIAAGSSTTVILQLSDLTAGTFGGNVVIHSNDPNTPAFTFAVTGTISPTIKINFQPDATPIPLTFTQDTGTVYGNHGNGFSYGWNASAMSFARDRNILADQARDTFIHTQLYGNRTWEIGVPNGAYQVHVVAGDPQYFDSTYKINVENTLAVNGKPTNTSKFVEGTATVIVTDGKLTLSNAAGAVNNKFDFVEITPVTLSTIKVNFQTPASPTPAGYLADSGAVFGDRGNGFSYGWNASATSFSRDRNAGNSPDQQHDTFIHTELYGNRFWELALPNGMYQVTIVAGDPTYFDSVYKYNIEGQLVLSGTPTTGNRWVTGTKTVTVSDGRLTLNNAAGSSNNKIDYIQITPM